MPKGVTQLSSLYMKAISNDIDDNANYIYRFYIEKYYQYRTIILIPEGNNKIKQIFISREEFEQSKQIEIDKQENGIIRINDLNEKRRNIFQFLDNYFMIFNSNLENLRFIYFDKITKNKKLVFNHYGPEYLYCERNEKDKVIINETLYQPKFVLFSILNDETIESFKTFLESNNIYMNKRINTNNLLIYDLINIYIDNFDIKYNLYIKKYYGSIQLYESEYELNDINKDINILTKPIKNLKNKKSIFNRLIQLNKNKLITGYISDNSLLDIYLEKDNDNKDIYLSDFKNRKYLKKGIEYQIHFNLNHLIRLECLNDNTEIIIYNEDIKIILDNKNQTGIVFGNNFKIKSNNNAMIYFYPKTKKFQIKLNPKKDEFIQIKLKNYEILRKFFSIDFGFEGYEPPDMSFDYPSEEVYIENLYNKLETKLAKGEYLYLYYNYHQQDIFEINYINNIIITSKFKYNFNILKANKAERKLIIPNINTKKITIKINKCNSQANNNIKIYYKNDFGDAVEVKEKKKHLFEIDFTELFSFCKPNYLLLSELKEAYILSYFYNDTKDDFILKNKEWEKDRIKYNNLTINNIKLISENEIKINFNINYKNSLTKYIIFIIPIKNNNTLENLKNICLLTELINNPNGNFISEEIYDIGENDFIEVNIDINKYISQYKTFFINIISQELRFEKDMNFYEPKIYYLNKNNNSNLKRNIFLIIGISLLLILSFCYYKNAIKNSKKHKNVIYEDNFGIELNDKNDFLNGKK